MDLVLPEHTPESIRRFLADVAGKAQAHGVALLFPETAQVPYALSPEMLVSGYFIDRPRVELAVALGKPFEEWLLTLVHESCHMDQWIERSQVWADVFVEGREAVDWIDEWITGKRELGDQAKEDLFRRARDVEFDCEKRAVAAIEAYGLPIDTAAYTRRANAYVMFYNHVANTRNWYPPGLAPYETVAVWSQAPDTFPDDPKHTPQALEAAFRTNYPG